MTMWMEIHGKQELQLAKPVLGEWKTCYRQECFVEVILYRLQTGHTHLANNLLLTKEEQPACDE